MQIVANDIIDLSNEHKLMILDTRTQKKPDSLISTVEPISKKDEKMIKRIISSVVEKGVQGSTDDFLDIDIDELSK